MLRTAAGLLVPALVNRYQRRYYVSADGSYRLTVDWGLQFARLVRFATGDDFWPQVAQTAHWLIEVDVSSKDRPIGISIVPTKHGRAEFPDARPARFDLDHPAPEQGPLFQSRMKCQRPIVRQS